MTSLGKLNLELQRFPPLLLLSFFFLFSFLYIYIYIYLSIFFSCCWLGHVIMHREIRVRDTYASCNVSAYMEVSEAILCMYMISLIIKEICIGKLVYLCCSTSLNLSFLLQGQTVHHMMIDIFPKREREKKVIKNVGC